MTKKVTEMVRAFRRGADGGGEEGGGAYWCATRHSSIIGSSGFGYEFRALETASISSSNTEENSCSLVDANTMIFNMSSPSRIVATLSIIFPSHFRQFPLLKPNRDVGYKTSPSKKSTLATSAEGSELKDVLFVMLKSDTYMGSDGESSTGDQTMTLLAAGHETTATSMIWAIRVSSLLENGHI